MRIYIWGIGQNGRNVLDALCFENCELAGFIDNNPKMWGSIFENYPVSRFEETINYDYIIISPMNYRAILYQLEQQACDMNKVICFYDEDELARCKKFDFINITEMRLAQLTAKNNKLQNILKNFMENVGYEIADGIERGLYVRPKIGKTEEAIYKIVYEGCSMIRFGDGEFEFMAGNERPVFQRYEPELGRRLKEVLSFKDKKLIIGIANNYGNLDEYIEDTANGIRKYMGNSVRAFHMSVLELDRIYYDAYMFKTYYPHKDKERTEERISLIKRIWDGREIIIIEGEKTRTGVGNNLFDNAKKIERVLCPTVNAYDIYDDILLQCRELDKEKLILMALGPAGKVLAFDLFKAGYQVVDIGQIDMDYEWYRAGVGYKVPINNKYVSQLPPAEVQEINDENYIKQIINKIENIQ